MLNTVNVELKTDIKTDRPTALPIKLMSQDKNNNQFILRFTSGGEIMPISEAYTVEILTKFQKSGASRLTSATVLQDYAAWEFDTDYITQDETVYNYVYVRKAGNLIVSADSNAFFFEVGVSEIDKDAGRVAEVYDENYQKYLDEFKENVDFEEIAQAESDRQANEDVRQANELLREENYNQKVDTAIVEADVVAKVDNKVTELAPQISNLTAQLAETATKDELNTTNSNVALKRDKSVPIKNVDLDTSSDANKIKLINLADEVQRALTGNAPALSTLQDGQVTIEKLAPKLQYDNYNSRVKNLFSVLSTKWRQGITSGNTTTVANVQVSINRVTSVSPTELISGKKLHVSYFNNVIRIAILQLDVNNFVLADSGWLLTNTTITLNANTRNIVINARYDNGAAITPENIRQARITIEHSELPSGVYRSSDDFNEFIFEKNKSDLLYNIDKNFINKNLFNNNFTLWDQGLPTYVAGSPPTIPYQNNRLTLRFENARSISKGDKITVKNYNSKYRMSVHFIGADYLQKKDSGWIADEFTYSVVEDAVYLLFIVSRVDNGYIARKEIEDAMFKVEYGSKTDYNLIPEYVFNKLNNQRYTSPFFYPNKFRFMAHRGAYQINGAPENSRKAFRNAGRLGFWGIETDVCETSDNKFIIMHDATIDRTTNSTGTIANMTLAQLQNVTLKGLAPEEAETIPTLKEFLLICKQYGAVPCVELKYVTNLDKLIDEVKNLGFEDSIVLMSFSQKEIENARKLSDKIHLQFLNSLSTTTIEFCHNNRNTSANVGVDSNLTETNIRAAHNKGVFVFTNTINDKAVITDHFNKLVDGVGTDLFYSLE